MKNYVCNYLLHVTVHENIAYPYEGGPSVAWFLVHKRRLHCDQFKVWIESARREPIVHVVVGTMGIREGWVCRQIPQEIGKIRSIQTIITIAVLAWLGLEAPALAWLPRAPACKMLRPGQSPHRWPGFGLAWPRPRLWPRPQPGSGLARY